MSSSKPAVSPDSTEKLHKQSDFLSSVLESLTHPFCVVDANDYTIALANSAARPKGPAGKATCYSLSHGRDEPCNAAGHICPLETVKKTRKPVTVEHTHYDKDGNLRRVEVRAFPIFDADDNVSQIIECSLDITDREQAAQEILSLKRQMEFVLGATKTGLDIIDSQFNVRYIDPEWKKIYGDPEGKKCYDYFMGRSSVCPGCGIVKAMETKAIAVTEEVLVRENNRPVQVTTIPYQNDKGEWLVAEVNVDITERKKVEAKQTELLHQLVKANRELKSFAYAAAHDLKSPLRAMGTLADWLYTDYAHKLDQRGAEQLRLLKLRSERMSRLIDAILQYSQVELTDQPTTSVDLNILVRDVIAQISPPASIRVIIENTLPTVSFAEAHLWQVFHCLIANAVTYLDKAEGRITVCCSDRPDFWEFAVADDGRGIEQKHFDRIFQLCATLTPRDESESTGVGLAVSRRIVEMYGGRIWVESQVGEGSTFFFTLTKQTTEVRNERPQTSAVG